MASPILLVEDDENDVFFFERAARRAEFSHPIHVARHGQEAIDFCSGTGSYSDRGRYPLPGLVVLDLNLPYRSGFDVLESLRRHPATRLTNVIIFTSSTADRDVIRAYSLGANSYLVKPAAPEALLELMNLIKAYWLRVNVIPPSPTVD